MYDSSSAVSSFMYDCRVCTVLAVAVRLVLLFVVVCLEEI